MRVVGRFVAHRWPEPPLQVRTSIFTPSRIRRQTSGHGLWRSADGGATFTASPTTGLPATNWGPRFEAVPGHEGHIWPAGGTGPGY